MPSISSDDKPAKVEQINYIKVKFEQEVVVPAGYFGYADDDTLYEYVQATNAKEAIAILEKCSEYSNVRCNLFEYVSFDSDDCKWKITITDYKEK